MNFKHFKGYLAELIVYIYFRFLKGYCYKSSSRKNIPQIDLEFYNDTTYFVIEVKYISDLSRYSYISFAQFFKQYLYMKKLYAYYSAASDKKEICYNLLIVNNFCVIQKNILINFSGQNPYTIYEQLHRF